MVLPNGGGSGGDPWWVIKSFAAPGSTGNVPDPNAKPVPTYQVVQGPTKPNPSLIQTFMGTTPVVTGPFATQTDAQSTIPSGAATGSGGGAGPGGSYGVVGGSINPFSSIQDALSAFYDVVTNGKMWRSLGWLVLGIFLLLVGLALWIGPTAFKATPVGRVLG